VREPCRYGEGQRPLELALNEKQIPQLIENKVKEKKEMEAKESTSLRPRQVRYQAALRPDMTCRFDSKALPDFVPPSDHGFYPQPCTYRALMAYCTVTVHF